MRSAFGFGIASTANTGEVLDVWFDSLGIGNLADNNGPDLSEFTGSDAIREVTKSKIAIEIDLDTDLAYHIPLEKKKTVINLSK